MRSRKEIYRVGDKLDFLNGTRIIKSIELVKLNASQYEVVMNFQDNGKTWVTPLILEPEKCSQL